MAQPPDPSPLRLQPSLSSSLDSSPVKPRVQQQQQEQQPGLDALAQQRQHSHYAQAQPQQLEHQQQQTSIVPLDKQPLPLLGPLQTLDAPTPTTDGGTHSIDARPRPSPGLAVTEKAASDGVSTVNGTPSSSSSSSYHASTAQPADPVGGDTIYGVRSEAQHHRDVPALQLPDTMSNTQPPSRPPPRQPVTYANAASYSPAGMPPVSHYAYPTHAVPAPDPYRPTPTTLPSMRTLDHGQPQPQSQHALPLGAHMAAPMAPGPAPSPMAYYGVHSHPHHVYGIPDPNTAMRFALAPGLAHDPRIALSGGRHKKEIKRRTKTGCLTCRKRRIKCDEAHPTCNNCKKSKRECLGYDPIFKPQQGPAAIQPAPSTSSQPPTPAAVVPPPTLPSSAPHHSYPAPYSHALPSTLPPESVVSTAPQSTKPDPVYVYTTAIDPALQGPDTTSIASARPPRYQQNNTVGGAEQGAGDYNHLRGGTPSSPSTLSALSQPQPREIMSAHTSSPAKKMKVDELIALGGAAPRPPSSPPSPETLDEITKLYYEVYVPGLVSFFETRWYDLARDRPATTNPAAVLHNNQQLISLFTSFIQNISNITSTDPVDMVHSGHLETSVVWSLARLPLSVSPSQRQQHPGSLPAEDDLWETRGRLQVFETLISGETLASNPLFPPPAGIPNTPRRNEFDFWYHLAKYLVQDHASGAPADISVRESCLSVMRSLLDGRENRDVLYSIAVLREYTAHWDASWNEQTVPSHLDESDSRSKLAVATRFIRGESTSTGGTTNVVRRFADLACRAFVRPGANVDRSRGGRN